jgi:mannose-6-phosphate isomerase
MWYVAHADPGARIYAGLRHGVTRGDFERALRDGTVADCVHHVDARTGDSLFVPSGRLHALGKGLLIYEIQQNSDTTYRVFDWNRPGLDGRPRTLHIDESMASIDFTDVEPALDRGRTELASCEHFRVIRMTSNAGDRARQSASNRVFRLIVPIAQTTWGEAALAPGDLALCPASLDLPEPSGEWLEITF